MNILQVVPHYLPASRFGGPLRVAHGLGVALVNAGHEVTVCTTNLADEETDLDVPTDQPTDLDGVSVYYSPTRFSRYWGYSPELKKRIYEQVPKSDVVLVHAHFQYANLVGSSAARRLKKPYVIFPHSTLRATGIAHKSSLLKKLYLRVLERQNLEKSLFVAFNAVEEQADSLFREHGYVVPNGISPVDFEDRPELGAFRRSFKHGDKALLLFMGRIDIEQKGLDFLVKAFAKIRNEHPDIHLVIAGPDENGGRAKIEAMAEFPRVKNGITFTGLVTGNEKVALLQDADAFVMSSRFEGSSIALLEALYFGKPMFVTDQVGMCEEIRSCQAGIVVPASQDGVEDGLRQVSDETVRRSFNGKGTELVLRKFTWDAIAGQLVNEIKKRTVL